MATTTTTSNKFVVHKFGGTSVGSAECFAKVSDIVTALDAPRIAVVVSAIGGKPKVTDLLISLLSLAKERKASECDAILDAIRAKHATVIRETLPDAIGKPIEDAIDADLKRLSELLRAISIMRSYNDSVVEFISGHGEVWSAKILTAVLTLRAQAEGKAHAFRFVDARDFLVVEPDDDHGPVVQYDVTTKNLEKIIGDKHTHLVITGFICSTTDGVMTTLKRDGSDFTASICGRVLKASSITIWTDVSGVLSSDPRRVPEAKILGEVSYEEAMELAYFGAKVIHPKTMTPAILEAIPIYIRNTFEPSHPGTKIHHRKRVELERKLSNGLPTAKNIVSGFSTVDDLALFNIEGSGMVGVHGTSSRLFSALDRVKVNVVLIAQASSEHSICFAVPMSRAVDAQDVVNETFFKEIHHGLIEKTEYIAPISIIAAVGDNMSHTPGVCSRFFGALGRAGINVLAISQGSSERNISAVVRYEDSAAALRAVHSSFFLSDQTISIGIVGLEHHDDDKSGGVGNALLAQYNQQREYLKQRFNVDIRIRAIATHSSSQMLLDHNGGLSSDALDAKQAQFEPFDHDRFLNHVCADHLPHWLIVDVSNCPGHVKNLYPTWLNRNVHLITANLNVAAASTSLHSLIRTKLREKKLTFDSEACLAIGVPVFNTIQNFVQTGDDIERVEFSGSRFLNAVLSAATSSESPVDMAALLTQHVTQFKATMSVRDILDDVTGVRSAKKAVLLARELGFHTELQDVAITSCWRYGSDSASDDTDDVSKWDYDRLLAHLVSKCEPLQAQVAAAVANRVETPALRLVASVNAQTGAIAVGVAALCATHAFAALQPLQCAFAFYTARHAAHPVVVSGPIADSSITAGTLFGSILTLARNCGARESGSASASVASK